MYEGNRQVGAEVQHRRHGRRYQEGLHRVAATLQTELAQRRCIRYDRQLRAKVSKFNNKHTF